MKTEAEIRAELERLIRFPEPHHYIRGAIDTLRWVLEETPKTKRLRELREALARIPEFE